jgi:hypothetical protein
MALNRKITKHTRVILKWGAVTKGWEFMREYQRVGQIITSPTCETKWKRICSIFLLYICMEAKVMPPSTSWSASNLHPVSLKTKLRLTYSEKRFATL